MSSWPQHIPAKTVHQRKGDRPRVFSYSVDFVLIDPAGHEGPGLFSRNRFNLLSVWDRDHGGTRGDGQGVSWAKAQFEDRGIAPSQVLLLTQPRFLGIGFNPVSFWLAFDGDVLIAAIAEVNNTFGDRHSYVCEAGGAVVDQTTDMSATKRMHVSPYQPVEGEYSFKFNILEDRISIGINLTMAKGGFFANLVGPRQKLTDASIARMLITRPFGSLRTIVLIYWQALKLKFRGETYRTRPAPPEEEIS